MPTRLPAVAGRAAQNATSAARLTAAVGVWLGGAALAAAGAMVITALGRRSATG